MHIDSGDDTVGRIKECIKPFIKKLAERGGCAYASHDMKTGVDNVKLVEVEDVLEAFLVLGPRGAYFKQSDIRDALLDLLNNDAYLAAAAVQHSNTSRWMKPGEDEQALDKWCIILPTSCELCYPTSGKKTSSSRHCSQSCK